MPQDPELLSRKLRGEEGFGGLLQMTGLQAAQDLGQNMVKSAGTGLEGLRKSRESLAQRELTGKYYDETIADKKAGRELDERKLKQALKIAQLNAASKEAIAKGKADKKKYGHMPDIVRRDANEVLDLAGNMSASMDLFEDDFAGDKVPGWRPVKNWLAANAPIASTPDSRAGQAWWANWDRIYNLPARNKMFGATLTDNEKKVWAAANINSNMLPDQIRKATDKMMEIYERNIPRYRRQIELLYGPDKANALFADSYSTEVEEETTDAEVEVASEIVDPLDAEIAELKKQLGIK